MKFNATVEFLRGQRAAIVTLTDLNGAWSGSSRIDLAPTSKLDLYEAGYDRAVQAAYVKGGTLETFRVV